MNRKGIIIGLLAVLAVLAACLVFSLKIRIEPVVEKTKAPERTRIIGEDIHLSQKGLYGIDLVSIGKAHMRKMRRGPISFGGLNELVLENVELALPEDLWREKAEAGGRGRQSVPTTQSTSPHMQTPKPVAPKEMLARLGVSPEQIRMGEKIPKFSGLAIKKLRVMRVDGTNAVPWFGAASAKAEFAGLRLINGWSFENGVSNSWRSAMLTVDPALELHH